MLFCETLRQPYAPRAPAAVDPLTAPAWWMSGDPVMIGTRATDRCLAWDVTVTPTEWREMHEAARRLAGRLAVTEDGRGLVFRWNLPA